MDHILTFLQICGGLAFFIYGMKVMSEGIQKVAGSRLKEILKAMTSNRLAGVGTGFLTTSIIQSSSATTVMVVSFVNAGLLSLRQAIGVIMGANIGTTMTAWILVFIGFKFSLSDYALPVLAFGVPMIFMNKVWYRNLGEFLVGFALLFIGLDALKGSVKALDLAHNEAFLSWITSVGDSGMWSILLFVFIGTLLTVIVQSSSAAMALTLTFIGEGLTYELAAAIILGENIGTTITANLAALVGNVHAKRAARAHLIFNLFGVAWMLLVFFYFIDWISDIFNWLEAQPWASRLQGTEEDHHRYSLALFHTVFNIINTVLLIWFVRFIEKTVTKLVKAKRGEDDIFHLEYIGNGTLRTPELSLLEAKKEVAKFGKITSKILPYVRSLLTEHNPKVRNKLLKKISHYEEITDRVEVEVATYLSKVSEGKLTEESSKKVRGMLSIVNDLERIGDIFYQMSLIIDRKNAEKIYFTPEQRSSILEMFDLLDEAFKRMTENLSVDTKKVDLVSAQNIEARINEKRNALRKEHLSNMEEGKYHVKSGMVYSELFSLSEKVGDHIINVSEGAVEAV